MADNTAGVMSDSLPGPIPATIILPVLIYSFELLILIHSVVIMQTQR